MAELHQEFLAAGAPVLAVAPASLEAVRAYLARGPLPFPLLADPTHQVFDQYGVESRGTSLGQRPGLFIIDVEGIVRFAHVGGQQWNIPSSTQVLRQVHCMQCKATV